MPGAYSIPKMWNFMG